MASESHPSVVPNDHLTLHTSENTLSFTQADIDAALDVRNHTSLSAGLINDVLIC